MTEKETTTGKVYDVGDVKIWRDGDTMYREMSGYVEMRPLYNEYEAGWPSLCGLATRAVAECIDLEPWLALVDAEAVEPEWARDDAEHVAAALGAPYADATSVQTLALLREGARMLWVGYTPGAVHVVADAWKAWHDLLIPTPPSGDWGDSSCFHWSFRSWDDVRVGGPGVTPLVAGVLQGTPQGRFEMACVPPHRLAEFLERIATALAEPSDHDPDDECEAFVVWAAGWVRNQLEAAPAFQGASQHPTPGRARAEEKGE